MCIRDGPHDVAQVTGPPRGATTIAATVVVMAREASRRPGPSSLGLLVLVEGMEDRDKKAGEKRGRDEESVAVLVRAAA
jgi:hypothetical protein